MRLDERELEILRHFERGPAAVKPLLTRMPRSSVYRRIANLASLGLLRRHGRRYVLQPEGFRALESIGGDEAMRPELRSMPLDRVLPHIRLAPTPFHASLLRLIACAVVARRHRVRQSHHPAFVIFGPKLRWKTWVAKAACHMAGANPDEDVIFLGTESGRSMLARKSRDGKRLTARTALSRPVVGLDEFLRAKPDVRRLLEVYLFGDVTVPDEDGPIIVEPVPIVTLNPREAATTSDRLDERLDLDDAMLRRSILADVTDVAIPDEVLAEGDARLEGLRSLGPTEFPAPRRPSWDPAEEIREALGAVLTDRERLSDIDISMVSMLACSATAWLPDQEAVSTVLIDYLSIVERLGWLRPHWRDEIESPSGRCRTQRSASKAPSKRNRLRFDTKLHQLADQCDRLGLDPAAIGQHLQELASLQSWGFSPEAARSVATALDRHGLTPKEAGRLARHLVESESLERIEVALAERIRALRCEASQREHRLAELDALANRLGDEKQDVAELCKLRAELRTSHLPPAELLLLAHKAGELATAVGASAQDAGALACLALEVIAAEVGEKDLFEALQTVASEASDVAQLRAVEARKRRKLKALHSATESARRRLEGLRDDLAKAASTLSAKTCRASQLGHELRETRRILSRTRAEHLALREEIDFAGQLLAFVHGALGRDYELWRRLANVFRAVTNGAPGPQLRCLRRSFRFRLLEHLQRAASDEPERRPEPRTDR